jgi:hypothetical protein
MCLAMNADRLEPGERCASTSNRNFEGRQGAGGRTHLVSPAMAAAAAMRGHFVDVRRKGHFVDVRCRLMKGMGLKKRIGDGPGAQDTPCKPSPCTRAWSPRWTAPTSTPTPSSPSSS